MESASPLVTGSFLALVAAMAALFVWAMAFRSRPPGEDGATSLRWGFLALVLLALWLVPSGTAAARGVLTFTGRPPGFFVLLALTTLATTILAFSPVGARLAAGIGLAGLVGFQAFRIPVELLLHRLYEEGVVPVQMTFAGFNFDIVSGILGASIGIWALATRPPRAAVLGFNVVGLALLVNIVTIAMLSTPSPMRRFHHEPANTFVAEWPFVWLPALLVQAAWLGHLLVFRKLAARRP